MKPFKFIFTVFLTVFLISCHSSWFIQDPLTNIPVELTEGVTQPGNENLGLFAESFRANIVQVEIINETDNNMIFQEGIRKSYEIKVQLLNDFNLQYEIKVLDSSFETLEGSTWEYNNQKNIGVLNWQPAKTFNQGRFNKSLTVDLSIQLIHKDRTNKTPNAVIKKSILVIVSKNYFPPKLIAIRTNYKTYIKLSDNKFYRNDGVINLNLNYYDKVFLGKKKRKEAQSLFELYTSKSFQNKQDTSFKYWTNQNAVFKSMGIDTFNLYDKNQKEVDDMLFPYIQRKYYRVDKNPDCATDICLQILTNFNSVPVDTKVFIKNYVIPETIDTDLLYYKVRSTELCHIYYNLSAELTVYKNKFESTLTKDCHLPIHEFRSQFKTVRETEEIYILDNNSQLIKVDVSKWSVNFEAIPDFIKWKISGYLPIPKNRIEVFLTSIKEPITFTVEDINLLNGNEVILGLRGEQIKDVNFTVKSRNDKSRNDLNRTQVELQYNLSADSSSAIYDSKFNFFSVTPFSDFFGEQAFYYSTGDFIGIAIKPLASIVKKQEFIFDPNQDISSSRIVTSNGDQEIWLNNSISINNQIQKTYILTKSIQDQLNWREFQSDDKNIISNIRQELDIKLDLKVNSTACENKEEPVFKNTTCECSEFSYHYQEEDVYIKQLCSYKTTLVFDNQFHDKLSTGQTNPSSEDNKKSGYVQYLYTAPTDILSVKSFDAVGKEKEADKYQTLSVVEKYYKRAFNIDDVQSAGAQEYTIQELQNNDKQIYHFLFNIKPDIECTTSAPERKECSIKYDIYYSLFENKRIALGELLEPHTICSYKVDKKPEDLLESDTIDCNCEEIKFWPPAGTKSPARLEFKCSLKNTTSHIGVSLKTKSPYLYFLNKDSDQSNQTLMEFSIR